MSSKFAARVQFTAGDSSFARMRVEGWLSRGGRARAERAAVHALAYAPLHPAARAGGGGPRAGGGGPGGPGGGAPRGGGGPRGAGGAGPGAGGARAGRGGRAWGVARRGPGRGGPAAVPLARRAPDPPLAGSSVLVDEPLRDGPAAQLEDAHD